MDKEKKATGNNANAANMTVTWPNASSVNAAQVATAAPGTMKIDPANAGNFTSGDTVTVNGAESATGAKIIPGTFSNLINNVNSSATLTVMSSSSSSSTLNSGEEESNIVVSNIQSNNNGHLIIAHNSTFQGEVQVPHMTITPGITGTFDQGVTAPSRIDTGENSATVEILENLAPCTITGNADGTIDISFLSGETTAPEIEHDA